MDDREKVIKGLETCIPMKYETNEEKECRHEQCPYGRENYKPMNGCFWDLMSDALALLEDCDTQIQYRDDHIAMYQAEIKRLEAMLKEHDAEWIEYPECLAYDGAYSDSHIVCSACKHVFSIMDNCTEEFDYCPHCGAKMKQEGR